MQKISEIISKSIQCILSNYIKYNSKLKTHYILLKPPKARDTKKMSEAAKKIEDKTKAAANTVKAKAGEAADAITGAASSAAETVKQEGQALKEKLNQEAGKAKEKAHKAFEDAKESADAKVTTAREKVGQMVEDAGKKIAGTVESASRSVSSKIKPDKNKRIIKELSIPAKSPENTTPQPATSQPENDQIGFLETLTTDVINLIRHFVCDQVPVQKCPECSDDKNTQIKNSTAGSSTVPKNNQNDPIENIMNNNVINPGSSSSEPENNQNQNAPVQDLLADIINLIKGAFGTEEPDIHIQTITTTYRDETTGTSQPTTAPSQNNPINQIENLISDLINLIRNAIWREFPDDNNQATTVTTSSDGNPNAGKSPGCNKPELPTAKSPNNQTDKVEKLATNLIKLIRHSIDNGNVVPVKKSDNTPPEYVLKLQNLQDKHSNDSKSVSCQTSYSNLSTATNKPGTKKKCVWFKKSQKTKNRSTVDADQFFKGTIVTSSGNTSTRSKPEDKWISQSSNTSSLGSRLNDSTVEDRPKLFTSYPIQSRKLSVSSNTEDQNDASIQSSKSSKVDSDRSSLGNRLNDPILEARKDRQCSNAVCPSRKLPASSNTKDSEDAEDIDGNKRGSTQSSNSSKIDSDRSSLRNRLNDPIVEDTTKLFISYPFQSRKLPISSNTADQNEARIQSSKSSKVDDSDRSSLGNRLNDSILEARKDRQCSNAVCPSRKLPASSNTKDTEDAEDIDGNKRASTQSSSSSKDDSDRLSIGNIAISSSKSSVRSKSSSGLIKMFQDIVKEKGKCRTSCPNLIQEAESENKE